MKAWLRVQAYFQWGPETKMAADVENGTKDRTGKTGDNKPTHVRSQHIPASRISQPGDL